MFGLIKVGKGNKDISQLYRLLARHADKKGNNQLALEYINNAIQHNPGYGENYISLARNPLASREEKIAACKQALHIGRIKRILELQAEALLELGAFDHVDAEHTVRTDWLMEAIALLEENHVNGATLWWAWVKVADEFFADGCIKQALAYYQEAFEMTAGRNDLRSLHYRALNGFVRWSKMQRHEARVSSVAARNLSDDARLKFSINFFHHE